MTLYGLDPGYEQSAVVELNDERVVFSCIEDNDTLLDVLPRWIAERPNGQTAVVIEHIESYGMAVGREVFDTVWWAGRFYEAAEIAGAQAHRLPRRPIKLHLCGSPRAKDSNIRQALIDRFGGKAFAVGTKKSPGPLYGVKSHEWAALAAAVTWWDTLRRAA